MLRVLNLGAGVQSTALYMMAVDGELAVDVAIFADTGDEPQHVYRHLEFLQSLNGPKIEQVRAHEKSLGDNIIEGLTETRNISIPVYLRGEDGRAAALGRRQCTAEYKIKPIDRRVRELVGLQPYQRAKEPLAVQIFGLSFDEPKRVANAKDRFRATSWAIAEFPLFDDYMTRQDCIKYLEKRLPGYSVPRSACVYCPFHNDTEWVAVKASPEDWARAVQIDKALRDPASACNQHMRAEQFLHKSCVPLDQVEFKPKAPNPQGRIDFSTMDCEGMCGL